MKYLIFLYAVLILVGGIMGHAKAGSTASLVMGVISGAFLLIAAWMMWTKTPSLRRQGAYLALIVTFLLDTFFSYRYMVSMKFMPSGLLSIASRVVILLIVNHLRKLLLLSKNFTK